MGACINIRVHGGQTNSVVNPQAMLLHARSVVLTRRTPPIPNRSKLGLEAHNALRQVTMHLRPAMFLLLRGKGKQTPQGFYLRFGEHIT